jgi:hypothetical protein
MSINDKDLNIRGAQSQDAWPGLANPSKHNSLATDPLKTNFVEDPTTEDTGAGAEDNFVGHRMAKKALQPQAGVIEARPGIIETTDIDPLNHDSNKGALLRCYDLIKYDC